MSSYNIANRKEKPIKLPTLTLQSLQKALENCKPKHKLAIQKEILKRSKS